MTMNVCKRIDGRKQPELEPVRTNKHRGCINVQSLPLMAHAQSGQKGTCKDQ